MPNTRMGTPIHQLMVENGVTVYFHGHDHAYAYEELDGVVYQECPKPDEAVPPQTSYLVESAANGGDHYPDATKLPASGHIQVTVSPSEVSIQYVKAYLAGQGTNGEIADSHVIQAPGPTHDLTMAVSPSGGGTTTPAVGPHSYAEGAVVNITASPNAGYVFSSWTGAATGLGNPVSVTMDGDKTVTANFAIKTYSLVYTAGAGGTISGTSPQTVNHGASGSAVTAVPAANYHFVQWSDGSTSNPRTDSNVTANMTVTVDFAINTHALTYTAGANGAITGTSPQIVTHGASGSAVTAVPAANYHFVQWSDGSTSNPRTDSNVTANVTVTANFAINTHALTYTAGANGAIAGTSPQTVNHGGSGTAVTALPNTGYHFVSWSDGVLTATRTDTNVQANLSVTANFAINTHALTYTAGANGAIAGTSPQTVNHGGSGTAVTALPSTGYHFVSWSDGVLTATRTDSNVQANVNATASFAIDTFALEYAAGPGGSLAGATSQVVAYGGDGAPVTATADPGYHFVNWSDASTANPRTDVNVTADVSVTASFARNTQTSIRGTHRYQTAQLVSQATFPGALPAGAGVVVAPGETFPEALCGAPLAAAYGGPVLLTPGNGLENGTRAELQRLAPTTVFVIGLSGTVVNAVRAALPSATVVAINGAGGSVYDMSRKVANALETKVGDMTGATAIITIGTNFPDAIGVSPLACAKLWPVILTDKNDGSVLHASALAALTDLGITKALKVGTYATLPGTVAGLANLSGANRYVTNANVVIWAKANAGLSFAHTGIATGDKFPDALAAGPYLAKDNGMLLLSPLSGPLPANIGALLSANAAAVQQMTFLAMIEPLVSEVRALLQ